MSDIIKFENIEDRIVEIRDQKVLVDADVAELYGVETKRINEAVKNNPDKFPNADFSNKRICYGWECLYALKMEAFCGEIGQSRGRTG